MNTDALQAMNWKKMAKWAGTVLLVFIVLVVWLGWDYDKPQALGTAVGQDEMPSTIDQTAFTEEEKAFFKSLENKTFAKEYLKSYRSKKPDHLSKEEWRQIHASLLGHPKWESERDRVAAFFKFQKGHERLSLALQTPNGVNPEVIAQAQEMSNGLLEGIKNEQISPTEALAMKMMALRVLEPNAQAQEAKLKEWAQEVKPYLKEPTVDPRDAVYLKRQDEVTAQWAKQYPPDATDVLEKMLSEVRKEVYGR